MLLSQFFLLSSPDINRVKTANRLKTVLFSHFQQIPTSFNRIRRVFQNFELFWHVLICLVSFWTCMWLDSELVLKLRVHLANVWPNKSERVWANARCAFTTAVRAFSLTSTCDEDMPIASTFIRHSSGISFDIRSFTAYPVNIGEWRTNMTKCACPCLLQNPNLANALVRLFFAKHIRQVYMRLNMW